MCDEQDGPLVAIQNGLQDLLRRDIQVIRGLVQEQEIRILECQLGEGKAAAFAAGEHGDALEDIIA